MDPSTLARKLGISLDAAARVAGLLSGELDPETLPGVRMWVRHCWCKPSISELIMAAIDETIGAFGVEALADAHGGIHATYVNRGDMYANTIVHLEASGEFLLAAAGDIAEAMLDDIVAESA